jgi:glucose uptake protein GlcU
MKKVFTLLLGISGAIAVLFVLLGGFQYMTSAGNEKQAETGKNNVMYAIIGLVVVILAYTIVNVVVRLVTK